MGAYLSRPITSTEPEDGEGNSLQFGASSMQGWRVTQEDAHNCLAKFDENSSLFAVYDGHGGAEVALYLSRHFPELLKNTDKYKAGEWKEALVEAYLKMDESIKTPEVLAEVVRLSKLGKKGELEELPVEENVSELVEEATMPIEQLVERYNAVRRLALFPSEEPSKNKTEETEEKPGSSKASNSTSPQKLDKEESAGSSSAGSSSSSSGSKSADAVISKPEPEVKVEESDIKVADTTEVAAEVKKVNGSVSNEATVVETEPVKVNGNGVDHEEIEMETASQKKVKLTNGDEAEISVEAETEDLPVDPKEVSMIINGSPKESPREDSILLEPSTAKPRKAKIQLPPVLQLPIPQSPVRTSPRRSSEKLYKEFVNAESGTSDSEDEEPSLLQRMALALGHSHGVDDDDEEDSDSEGTEDGVEGNSSSTDEDDEEDDEDEDEEEDEDDLELNDIQEPGFDSGATAVMAFSRWEGNLLHLWVANAGDSRCVVCRDGVALEMSQDHKPEEEVEARRIVAAGGKVTSEGRVNGGLNLSRAIGDHSYKQNSALPLKDQMITSLPDVEYALLNPATDKFLVLACDGIWNSMTSQQVVDFVGERITNPELKLSDICEQLFRACLSPDTLGDGTGCDNMTAIVVRIGENTGIRNEAEQKEIGVKRSHDSATLSEEVPEVETKRVRLDGEEEAGTVAE